MTILQGESGAAVNTFAQPQNVFPQESTVVASGEFTLDAPAYSLTILRLCKK